MKILHILRSAPAELTRFLIRGLGGDAREVALYEGPLDYANLVEAIFESDQVICWW